MRVTKTKALRHLSLLRFPFPWGERTTAPRSSVSLYGALLAFVLLAVVGVLLPPRAVHADATTYSTNKREFKVGILLIDSTTVPGQEPRGPENPDPFLFYISDARTDVKPQNWDFVNPLAPGAVTADIRDRWVARDPAHPYDLGQKVTKNMAAYWEVSLSRASIQELLQFDLLFITNHRVSAFSPQEREKLRKLVDSGGVVWIEDCGNMRTDPIRPFFLDQLQFSGGGVAGSPAPVVLVPDHPILNTPYQLSFQEIANIGDKNYGDFALKSFTPNATLVTDVVNTMPNPEVLVNIIANGNVVGPQGPLPYIAAGAYGSGAVIATAGDSGCDINDYAGGTNVGSGGNSGAYCGPNIITAHVEDLKFLYNIVSWGGSNSTYRRNNRRTAASFESVGAPLVTGFKFDNAITVTQRPTDIVDSTSAPLIVKNTLFISGVVAGSNNATIRSYDLNPFSDRDRDGNPDDGLPDLSLGLPYDEIWRLPIGTATTVRPSTPVYGSVYNGAGGRVDKIFVASPDGSLAIITAFPTNASGVLQPVPPVLPIAGTGGSYDANAVQGVAPAPVFNENKIYQVEPNGLVRCIDANTGDILWTTFTSPPSGVTLLPTGTPTLGYSRQAAATGFAQSSVQSTNDLMLYVPVLRSDTNGYQAAILPYWVGTRNEVQIGFPNSPDGAAGIIQTRVGGGAGGPQKGQYTVGQAFPYVVPKVRIFAGDPVTDPIDPNRKTARDYYALGIPTAAYATSSTPPVAADGSVQIVRTNAAYPDAKPGADILISVDYDVDFIDKGTTEPPNYGSNPTQIGARPGPGLTVPFYQQDLTQNSNLTTPAFSAEDLLIYGVQQQWVQNGAPPTATPQPVLPSIFAVNEQEGDAGGSTSRTRWRYGIFNDFVTTLGNPYDSTVTRTVDQVQVTDTVPLRNFLRFDPTWPSVTSAVVNTQVVAGNAVRTPESLRNVRIVGSPIVTNDGITYVLASAKSQIQGPAVTEMSVLMAFRTNPEITLNVPEPFDEQQGVTVAQADMLSDPTNQNAPPVQVSANQQVGPQMDLDGSRGRITIKNLRVGNKLFNAGQSFVVRYTPRNKSAEVRYVVPPIDSAQVADYTQAADAAGGIGEGPTRGGYSPLLWYYVLPGKPISSPTLIGDYIYYRSDVLAKSYTIAVDANPADKDPQVRVGLGENVPNVTTTQDGNPTKINHVRMTQELVGVPAGAATATLTAPPVGAQSNLVVNSNKGTFDYQTGVTLIADANRLVETGADASALWTLDTTVNRIIAGGDLPIYGASTIPGNPTAILNPPATGRVSISRDSLTKPQLARKVNGSDYLIADTGNNRVVRVDRSGNIIWTLSDIADPYNILGSGDPTSLSGPTDALFYIQPTPSNGGYEVHYLIADANNYRLIEVADYYNQNGVNIDAPGAAGSKGKHVLVWTTRTSPEGRRLRYTNVQRFLGIDPTGAYYGYPYVTATVGNISGGDGSGQQSFTGNSIVSVKYIPYNTAFIYRDAAGNVVGGQPNPNPLWQGTPAQSNEPTKNGLPEFSLSRLYEVVGGVQTPRKLDIPTYFQQINIPAVTGAPTPTPRTLMLVCDAQGAYVIELKTDAQGAYGNILWIFTQSDYNRMNGISPGSSFTSPITGTLVADSAPKGTIIGPTVNPAYRRLPRLNIPAAAAGTDYTVGMLIPTAAYEDLPRFRPSSLQLLPSGNYLITNSAGGRSSLFDAGQFNGEVFEVFPFGLPVLTPVAFGDTGRGGEFADFAAPRLDKGTSALGTTNRLNRQVMGNPESNTGLLEQPLSASRP